MTHAGAAGRDPSVELWRGWSAVGVPLLAVAGYLIVSDLRVSAALSVAAVLAAWSALAFYRPRWALSASFLMVLVAGTKFRLRDPAASLEGTMDAQILLEIMLFAVVGAGLLVIWFTQDDRHRMNMVELIILGYVAVALVSTLWSIAPALTLVRATQLMTVAALAIIAVRILAPSAALRTACTTLGLYVLSCAALAAVFPWASGTNYYDEGLQTTRFAWFSVHPVEAGTLAAIGALGFLSASLFAPRHGKRGPLGIPPAIYGIPLVLLLVLTKSRGPILAFVAGLATLLLLRMRSRLRTTLMLIAASFVLIFIAFGADARRELLSFANQDSALSQVIFRGQTTDTVFELNGRLGLWDDLRPAIAAHSVIGYGFQASRPVVLDAASWAAYAHNALLQSILDLGLIGTLALLAIALIGLFGAMRNELPPRLRATVAAVMVFLTLNSVATESFAGAPGFETLLLLVCALCAVPGQSLQAITRSPTS